MSIFDTIFKKKPIELVWKEGKGVSSIDKLAYTSAQFWLGFDGLGKLCAKIRKEKDSDLYQVGDYGERFMDLDSAKKHAQIHGIGDL